MYRTVINVTQSQVLETVVDHGHSSVESQVKAAEQMEKRLRRRVF